MKEILIATGNLHKLEEFQEALGPFGYKCLSLKDVGYYEDIIEDGETFFDNAYIKAKTIADKFNIVTLADDSGLVVEALPNELGVKSKRFSKTGKDMDNNLLLLEKLKDETNRTAYFITQLVLYYPSGLFYTYQGRVYGHIAYDFKGDNGFGYDPLFQVDELGIRMAELNRNQKNQISHRGRAIKKLVEDLRNEVISI